MPETSVAKWLQDNAPNGARIGYDPGCTRRSGSSRRPSRWPRRAPSWSPVKRNPIDAVWADRPEPSKARLAVQSDEFAGKGSAEKRHEMADWLAKEGADAAVLAALDSIAWTFNVRGTDVTHTPVALAFALVNSDGTADLFVEGEKIGDDVRAHLGNGVRLHERDEFESCLKALDGKLVAVDPERSVAAIYPGAGSGRGPHPQPPRSGRLAQGDQEQGRSRRSQGGPGPRRRGGLALPEMDRRRGAQGRASTR